ncbi:methyltransferase domain-containing protein [Streptomyces sp. NPDC021224]|uniref:methyltransferase domain-containing protein n=1 Tax=unclassified Streptomyces TaxID=2593676 RepID=UPI00379B88E9
MNVSGKYAKVWESFWEAAPGGRGGVLWDAEPELTVGRHLAHFAAHFDPGLPLVDLGCGNGTLTRWLAGRYDRVVGADLAHAAVARAARDDPHGLAAYQQLDAVDTDAVRALHDELGDANVYLRGVLHQSEPADRARLVDGIATLTGHRGRVFAVEPAEAAKGVLLTIAQDPAGPPPKLGAVLAHGIAPGEVADAALPGYFAAAGLTVLAAGEEPLVTAEFRSDGARIELPSQWLVAGMAA